MSIYLDHAATSPLRQEIVSLWQELQQRPLGNPSSIHRAGHAARMYLESAREECANLLGAQVEEVVFTSGATEANNLAVFGWMRQQPQGAHCLVSSIEHPSVYEAALALRSEGYQVELIEVDHQGVVQMDRLQAQLRPETALVAVMAVNNEIGVVQPISQLTQLLAGHPCKLLVDAVQSPVACAIPALEGIDFLSLSGHKLGAPVGCGLLYLRQGLRVAPLFIGGAQEDSRRAGTTNVIGAALLARGLHLAQQHRLQRRAQMEQLKSRLGELLAPIEGSLHLSPPEISSPHISAWTFEGVPAESLLVRLDMLGIFASSGSACSSHSLEPSRTLKALGLSDDKARGLVRFSFSEKNSQAEIERTAQSVRGSIEQIRRAQALA